MHEQSKAVKRRFYDGAFHTRYFVGDGIDVGGKPDPLDQYIGIFPAMQSVRTWDIKDGNGQFLSGIPDNSYDFLVSSHSLEHMVDVRETLKNWIRVVKPEGFLIITVPDEDLYELENWPSKFNADHKWTFTIYKRNSWSPKSINVVDLIIEFASLIEVERIVLLNDFFREALRLRKYDQTLTSVAECSIEFIVRKKKIDTHHSQPKAKEKFMNHDELRQKVMRAGLDNLWAKAAAALENQLACNGPTPETLERLGKLYRKSGNLTAAANAYQQLSQANPSHPTAAYLHSLLSGLPSQPLLAGCNPVPAPFALFPNFLTAPEREYLFDMARQRPTLFAPLPQYVKHPDQNRFEARHDRTMRQQLGVLNDADVSALITPKVLALLPDVLPRLHIPPFPLKDTSIQLSLTHHGHFGKPHRDDFGGQIKAVFLYYFHQHPKAFTGGDLLLYDTNIQQPGFVPGEFTRVVHQDNQLLIFPSEFYHEITPVSCESDAFEHGRFAVAGHLHADIA